MVGHCIQQVVSQLKQKKVISESVDEVVAALETKQDRDSLNEFLSLTLQDGNIDFYFAVRKDADLTNLDET